MKTEQLTTRRVLSICMALAMAAPLAAQGTATQQEQQLKNKVQDFETMLVNAVRHGATAFAQKAANQIPPNVQLTSDDPLAIGLVPPTPDGGMTFVVVVPPIRQFVALWLYQQSPRGLRNVGSASGALPDPMDKSPVINTEAPAMFNPDLEYSKAVVEALVDTMLDNSAVLPLKESEWLTVAAFDAVGPTPGAVNSPYGHTTYLSIKGEYLFQLRQGKITRDEARKLIVLKQL